MRWFDAIDVNQVRVSYDADDAAIDRRTTTVLPNALSPGQTSRAIDSFTSIASSPSDSMKSRPATTGIASSSSVRGEISIAAATWLSSAQLAGQPEASILGAVERRVADERNRRSAHGSAFLHQPLRRTPGFVPGISDAGTSNETIEMPRERNPRSLPRPCSIPRTSTAALTRTED